MRETIPQQLSIHLGLKVFERSFSGDIRCCQTKAKLIFYRLSKPNLYKKAHMIQENNSMYTNDLKSYKKILARLRSVLLPINQRPL